MPTIFLSDQTIENTIEGYLPKVTPKSQLIYISILIVIILSLISLPFINVNISIQSSGIIRPIEEKSGVTTLTSGNVDSVLVYNGESLKEGQPLLIMDNTMINSKLQLNRFQQKEKIQEIHDLKILVHLEKQDYDSLRGLSSPLYESQYSQFIYNLSNKLTTQRKLQRDLNINQRLYDSGKVVPLQQLEDAKYEYNKSEATFNTTFEQQISTWQNALTNTEMDLGQLQAEDHEMENQKGLNTIKAPVSGTLQQFQGIYKGSYIEAGSTLGIISPASAMIAECYVKPADIGLIKKNMKVRFQVAAFNYNQWGLLDGEVTEISNDFVTVNNSPVFIVRCKLDRGFLQLKNGYKGWLKKGMTVNGRFIIARRSLYELLYDKMSNWLNPNGQP